MSAAAPRPRLRSDVRATAMLAAPLVLGHLATGLIGFVDSVIAGRHGTSTLAAVAVGTALFWLPMMLPMGTLMALPAAVSRLHGSDRPADIGPLFRQGLWLALALGLAMFCLISFAPRVLGPMGIDPDILPGATAFLHGIRWGVPALTLYLCMRYLSDGLHWTLPTMVLGFGGLLVLVPAGIVLAFGKLGFPEMGAGGLGIASSLMLWCQALAFLLYLLTSRRFADLSLFERFEAPDWQRIRPLLATGLPIGVMVTMESGLFVATALLIGRIGETPVAAHQVAINVASLAFMIPFGIAEATTVRVGHALGRGSRSAIRRAALAGLTLLLLTQSVSALLLLAGNQVLAGLYTRDAAVAALAAGLLVYAAAFQIPDGIQAVAAGALRGLGDTRVPMLLTALAYWGIGFGVGSGLGLGLGWGPTGMWIGLIAGLSAAAVLLTTRLARSIARA
ncbi:MAG: MATE family efflux transporter [Pseudoxanthomonas suwonensis]|nr:MATE family efflux transporter [Pseudoxanthomonas suwonensis]